MCVYLVNSVHLVFIHSLSKSGIRFFSVATVIFYSDAAVLHFSRWKKHYSGNGLVLLRNEELCIRNT